MILRKISYILSLGVLGIAMFVSAYSASYINSAYACTNASDLTVGMYADTPQVTDKNATVTFHYSVQAKNCASPPNPAELSNLQVYTVVDSSTGSYALHYMQNSLPASSWGCDSSSQICALVGHDDWQIFKDVPTVDRVSIHPEIISTTNPSAVLNKGDSISISVQGAAPINSSNTPGNGCTGPGCGTVSNVDFDQNILPLNNPINIDSFSELVVFVLKGFFFLIGIMAVLIIVVGGVRLVLSQGSQESITKGKQTIIWAVAGLVVALMAYSLVGIVQNLLSK